MSKRFFKLLYVLSLITIGLGLVVLLLTSIRFDRVVTSSYKAKCLSNNQYVVLQGSPVGEAVVLDEIYLESSENRTAIMEQLNFYCKYYDEIQPHIVAYSKAKILSEEYTANLRFTQFENSKEKVYAYPELYKLEVVKNYTNLNEILNPLIDSFSVAVFAFILLQILRVSYVYTVFGEIVWNPFKQNK